MDRLLLAFVLVPLCESSVDLAYSAVHHLICKDTLQQLFVLLGHL